MTPSRPSAVVGHPHLRYAPAILQGVGKGKVVEVDALEDAPGQVVGVAGGACRDDGEQVVVVALGVVHESFDVGDEALAH